MGAVFGCLEPVLVIAAALSHRDPFLLPLDNKAAADQARAAFAAGSRSDHIALLRAFQVGARGPACWRPIPPLARQPVDLSFWC